MTHSHVVTQSNIDTIVALITKTIHQQGSVIVDIYDGPSRHDGIVEKINNPENYVSCTEDDIHSDGAFASFINNHG